WGNDSYEVLVSTATNDPADFTNNISGGLVEAPASWTEHTYNLSAYDNQEIYLAIHHVSTDMFMLWIDDMDIYTEWSTPLIADFTADNTTIPVNGTVNFMDMSTGSPTSWSWNFGDSGTSSAENPSHQYTAAGTYTVELTISDGANYNTETKVDYIIVTELAPVADFTASPTYSCDGNVQFTDQSSNADTWEWDFGDGNTSTDQNPLHTYASNGTYTVSLTVTNGAGSDTHTETNYITVEIPDATIDPVADMCETDAPVTLTAATSGGTWSGPGVSAGEFDPSSAGSGNHTISYEVTIGTCTDSDTEIIHVDAMPDINITNIGPFCEGDAPVSLSATPAGGTWTGNGVSSGEFSPVSAGPGDYTITYEVTNGQCTASDNISIHVDAIPDISIDPVSNLCIGDSPVTLSATPAGGTWSGTGISGNEFDPGTAGIGTHTITYEVSNGACVAIDHIDLYVSDGYDATINPIDDLCESDVPITLTATDAGGTWSGTGVTGDQFDPATAGPGDFTITYEISGSCGDSDTEIIHVDAMPDINITNIGPFCEGDAPVSLSATPAGGTWTGNGVSSGEFSPVSAGIGTHTITYEVTNGVCTATESIDATVYEQPDATIDDPGTLCVGDDPVTLTAATSGGDWSGDGVAGDEFDPAIAGVGYVTIFYEVTVGSCSDSDEITVMVGASPDVTIDITNASSSTASDGSATATPSGGLNPYEFQWSNGDTDNTMEDVPAGLYSLIVTDAAGCVATLPVEIDFVDAITGNDMSLTVYPNPATNCLFIEMTNIDVQQINMVNTLGQTVINRNVQSDVEKLDISEIKPGVYFLEINTETSQYIKKVFVK
ncbi:MAG: PKD domain-containing protein, partial [Bacteroidota bacterium]|nr:PKD domain-containing protein [Bacteroidota bacterium]